MNNVVYEGDLFGEYKENIDYHKAIIHGSLWL